MGDDIATSGYSIDQLNYLKSNYNEQLNFDNTTKIKIRVARNGDLFNNMFENKHIDNYINELWADAELIAARWRENLLGVI